jgi:hypothetical protein
MKLALPVGLAFMIKAFGENVVKIIMRAVYNVTFPDNHKGDE